MLDIIFFAAIAAFIGFRLYNVLGHRNFESGASAAPSSKKNAPEKVIDASYIVLKPDDDKILEEKFGKNLAEKIGEVKKYDSSFTVESFITGAKKAFEIIVKAFSAGNKEALKTLLSSEVYTNFVNEIDKRETKNRFEETTLVAILAANIKNIMLNRKYVRVAVQIVSEQINIIRDKQGKIIEGNPSQVTRVEELWTFGRDLGSTDPNWELLEIAAV